LKTVLVNGRFLTRRTTGVERYARGLFNALHRAAADVRFLVAVPPGEIVDPPAGWPLRVDGGPVGGILWEQARLPRLLKKWGADILWSPCNTGPWSVKDQIVTIHDASVFAGPQWFSWKFRAYYQWLQRALGRRVRRVLTDSFFSRDELVRHGVAPAEKVAVVPAGVALTDVPAARNEKDYVFCLGSRDPRKNLERLLAAWAAVPLDVKGGRRLKVAGGGGRAFGGENGGTAGPDVDFLGYVPDADLPALFDGAQALVFPSLYEGFGLPPLEAMARGVPALVSDIPPLRELCGDAVLYCDPLSPGDIADRLKDLLLDENRRRALAAAGRRRAEAYTWERAADVFLAVLRESR